jgi:membrane dipeptidase
MSRWKVAPEAAELHADALVWDMTLPIITPGDPERKSELFAASRRHGFDFQSITIAVDGMDFNAAAQSIIDQRQFAQSQPESCVLIDTVDEILDAKASGKLAVGFHFQGSDPFGDNLGTVDLFYKLGIRHALMAYNEQNRVGSGCHVKEDGGLTQFGKSLIREMNRIGMMVDCAHTGYRTTMETLEASEAPAIISHTNVRSLSDHPRCVWDDQIQLCAAKGGVLGITGLSAFLGKGGATPARLADHIDHVANLVGPEHVGLGLDYVYDLDSFMAFVARLPERYPPADYRDMEQLSPEDAPRITEELLRRGYGEREVRGILGENWLRVCRQIWR